ncbi:Lrp/AsnC family transcriptional regulator [Halogeometricum borinquense]|uniref:Lrp/AsnC family transcriptional regulator n=1 Tax=Halogeometricum borinquense TaxID=60847 RepID=A0A6C0UPH7_9EURY|nr:Lrp/AsnC ligand binding domain-containing protein [Halogeometricum borinquense]QIB75789.1 Lrp/AsnC family transcriptional regulator [Halogeometricum borinquense]QIQ75630.1 Lrp/AsnC family transcriptional regulator [Halogeometricum borinquense]
MVTAYVMVKASTGDVDRLKESMLNLDDGVKSVNIVAGDVDFIVKADVESPAEVKTIAASIHEMSGIERTQTYIAMD